MATLTIADLDNGKRDLQTVDAVANSRAETATTRYGQQTTTLYESIRRIDAAGAQILANLGYFVPVDYAPGLSVTEPNFTVIGPDGNIYAAQAGQLPFTTGVWNPGQWYPIQNGFDRNRLLTFETLPEAQAASATLPDGQRIEVIENQWSYSVAGGGLTDEGPTVPTGAPESRPVPLKVGEKISAFDYPGDNSAKINSAVSAAASYRSVQLGGAQLLVEEVTNHLGAPLVDGSVVVTAPQGGIYQLNSYGDLGKEFIGAEYLYRLFVRVIATGAINGFIYGDSTVATAANGGGYAGPAGEPQVLFPLLASSYGVKVSLTNRGVGGTGVGDMNAIPDIDTVTASTDLFIIKYGINDAAYGLEGFASRLRAKLTEIRANPWGGVSDLAIVLCGPNSTHDPEHGRSSVWYEQIRGVYEQAARDFGCAYFDAYAHLRRIEWAATASLGKMMDDPFGNGQGVHPKEVMQSMLWGKLADYIFGSSGWEPYRKQRFSWNDLSLSSGWAPLGGGNQPPQFGKTQGAVELRGMIAGGTITAGTTLFTLPEGYRPQYGTVVGTAGSGGSVQLRVQSTGVVEIAAPPVDNSYLSLSGLRIWI